MAAPRNHVTVAIFLLLFQFVPVSISQGAFKSCSDYQKAAQPTVCLRLQQHSDKTEEYTILTAIGALKLSSAVFPLCNNFWGALIAFDEPLSPIPLGPSIYFWLCIAILFSYVMSKLVRSLNQRTRRKMMLHPIAAKLPHLPLYWLQQSKREQSLKREFRTTWAWLAKKFLLSPSDPLLEGIELTLSNTTWEDFEVPRDTWALIHNVLKLQELYVDLEGTTVDAEGRRRNKFRLSKARRDAAGEIASPFSRLPKDVVPDDLKEGGGDEEEEVRTAGGVWKLARKATPPDPLATPSATGDGDTGRGEGDANMLGDKPLPSTTASEDEQAGISKQEWKGFVYEKRQKSRASLLVPTPIAVVRHHHKTKHIRHHRKLHVAKHRPSSLQSTPDLQFDTFDHTAYKEAAKVVAKKSHPHPPPIVQVESVKKISIPKKVSEVKKRSVKKKPKKSVGYPLPSKVVKIKVKKDSGDRKKEKIPKELPPWNPYFAHPPPRKTWIVDDLEKAEEKPPKHHYHHHKGAPHRHGIPLHRKKKSSGHSKRHPSHSPPHLEPTPPHKEKVQSKSESKKPAR